MRAFVTHVHDPFNGHATRFEITAPVTIRDLAPQDGHPFIAVLNGTAVLRAGWDRPVGDADILVFRSLPQGGGGARGGSNPLSTILSLGMLAFAPWAAAGLLGTTTALVGTTFLGQATTLAISLAGNALVSALLPTPGAPAQAQPSPTYTLTAQGNAARIDAPIPVQYGRLKVYPDLAAQPYAEFAGGEQYLYQLLCLGSGEFEVEEMLIEDTPLSSFAEVTTEIIPPGGQVTLFPANVVTATEISGQTLAGRFSGTWSRSGTTVTITETAHGRAVGQAVALTFTTGGGPNGVYAIATVIGANSYTVQTATGTGSGNVSIHPVVGGVEGVTVNAAGTVAARIGVDLVLPRGLHGTSGGTLTNRSVTVVFEGQQIDDADQPLGSWTVLGSETLTDRTVTPLRKSFSYSVTPGRWRLRAWRTDVRATGSGDGHDVLWSGARAYLTETADYGDVTLIAVRMRATDNLSAQASRKIAVVAIRKLAVWNGAGWSAPVATRSIAWAIADAARNADYGAGWSDSRIDLAALLALDAEWAARGDQVDIRFDADSTWWDAVSEIARVGRARVFLQGGRLRVVRDRAETVPVAAFSMRNILRDSFVIDYLSPAEDSADSVEVTYFDARTWSDRTVLAQLPEGTADLPVRVTMRGITAEAQALREGLYLAATNRWRRRIVRFDTEMDGFIPAIGDLIAIQHDLLGLGTVTEALAWDPENLRLQLSEPVTFTGSHVVGLRRADGSLSGPWPVVASDGPDEVILTTAPDVTPYTGAARERTHVLFGTAQTWRMLAKVVSARPTAPDRLTIEAVVEDDRVHLADNDAAGTVLANPVLPRRPVRPAVSGLSARRMPGETTRAIFGWAPAPGADLYQIEMAEGANPADPDVTWTRAGDTTGTSYVLTLMHPNRTMIRVRGLGLAAGPWVTRTLGELIPDMWNTDDTPMWTGDLNPMWSS